MLFNGKHNVQQSQWKNRKTFGDNLLLFNEVELCRCFNAAFHSNTCELFCFGFGRWVILFDLSDKVCNRTLINKLIKMNVLIEFIRCFRLPFNWKTPFGYLTTFLIQCSAAYTSICCFIPMKCFIIGCCVLFATFVEDITHDLSLFNTNKSINRGGNGTIRQFCNIVQFHSNVKELSELLENIDKSLLEMTFIYFLFNMILESFKTKDAIYFGTRTARSGSYRRSFTLERTI